MWILSLSLSLCFGAPEDVPTCPEVEILEGGPLSVLVIPAMSARGTVWRGFMARNRDRYTTYAVTPPGFGGSPAPDLPRDSDSTPWTNHALDAIEQVIDRYELEEVALLGHSWGAGIAVLLADRRPEVVRAVVNVDGLITMDPEREKEGPAAWRQAADANVLQAWRDRFQDPEEWAKFNGWPIDLDERSALVYGMNMATPKEVVLQCWREMWMWDLNPAIRRLDVPLLDLQALKPNDPDQEQTRRDYLSRLKQVGVPDTHQAIFLYHTRHAIEGHRPEEFDRLVRAFLEGNEVSNFRPDDED